MIIRISEKRVVTLATLCFIALMVLQATWVYSVYETDLKLHEQNKRSYEALLQSNWSSEPALRIRFRKMIDDYETQGTLNPSDITWFHGVFVPQIEMDYERLQLRLYIDNIALVRQTTVAGKGKFSNIIFGNGQEIDPSLSDQAGKLCINCMEADSHEQYFVLIFYKPLELPIFNGPGLLILASLIIQILLIMLFRNIVKKHREVKKLSEAKNDFINNLTHEMQTPVFTIRMANKLIQEKTGEQLAALTNIIDKETSQLKDNAAKILELASIENEQVTLQKETVDLNVFLKDKLPALTLLLETNNGSLQTNFAATPAYTQIDKVHLTNIIHSLVDNAIKYSETAPVVYLETGIKDSYVYFTVRDNGIGIERQYVPFIFDKFYRVPAVNNRPTGFGLGLSYVKQIVQLHHGEIKLKSEPGRGTAISIFLLKSGS